MDNDTSKPPPQLQLKISRQETSLEVEYKVSNSDKGAIYLFNVIPSLESPGSVSEHPLYISLRDDGTLTLAKMIPTLPRIMSVEVREIPFVTKIEAGQEFVEKITLPIPVEEYNPYFPKTDTSKTEERVSEWVVFTLQYIDELEELKIEPAPIGGSFKVWHPNLFGNVQTVVSHAKPLQVTVSRRLDGFERF